MYTEIRLLLLIFPLFLIFLSLQFSNIKIFCHTFLRNCEAKKVQTCYAHGKWVNVSCIPESCCCSYLSLYFFFHFFSFFFLSNFQTLKIFSGAVRPRRLKLGTHADSGQMYCVYQNQAAAAYSFLYFSFPPIFKQNFSSHFSQELWGVEDWNVIGTHVDSGQMYHVYQNQAAALIHPSVSSFFFLSNFQTLKFFVTLLSGSVRPKIFKLGTLVDNGWMYRVYQNGAAAAYLFLFLHFSFSQIIKH